MICRWIRPLLLFLFAFAVTAAQAQVAIVHTVDSLDVMVAGAETVAFGTVESAPNGDATFNTSTVLKGPAKKQLKGRISATPDKVEEWQVHSAQLLLFAKPHGSEIDVIDIDDPQLAVRAADFSLIKEKEELLRRVGELVKRFPKPDPRRHTIGPDASHRANPETDLPGHSNLAVPIDERLERWARAKLRSPNEYERRMGLGAIAYFKSPSNISLAKQLLKDPAFYSPSRADVEKGIEQRSYSVREAAYRLLHDQWKLSVREPLMYERINRLPTIESLIIDLYRPDSDISWLAGAKRLKTATLFAYDGIAEKYFPTLAKLSTLENLQAKAVHLTDRQLRDFQDLKNLKVIDLENNPITDESIPTLASFPKLRYVNLTGTEVTEEGLRTLRRYRPSVRVHPVHAAPPIHYYLHIDDFEGVRRLLDRFPDVVRQPAPSGDTPLHAALRLARLNSARLLIERGAPTDARDQAGQTPLELAKRLYKPDQEIIKLLEGRQIPVPRN